MARGAYSTSAKNGARRLHSSRHKFSWRSASKKGEYGYSSNFELLRKGPSRLLELSHQSPEVLLITSSVGDVFNVPQFARLPNPPKGTDYVAMALVFDGATMIGFAMVTVSEWTDRRHGVKRTRPMAEVLLQRTGAVMEVPDDGLIGDEDPAYEALGRGELLWSGRRFRLEWADEQTARKVYRDYFT